MKILFVADVSIKRVIGGAERVLFEQGVGLRHRGHDVQILTRALPDDDKQEADIQGIREWRYGVKTHNDLIFLITSLKNSKRLFESLQQRNDFDVIIFHQPFSAIGVIRSSLSKRKKIYICHSLSFEEYISRNAAPKQLFDKILYRLNITLRKRIEKRVLNSSSKIVVLSRFTREKLLANYKIPFQKISIVPGGVDLDRFQPAADKKEMKKKLQIPGDRVVLLTVRNLVPRMGLENLVGAVGNLSKNTPDIYLIIGGTGPLKHELNKMIRRLKIEDTVRLVGFVPEEMLPNYYQAADLFIIPSKELEGFGLVTLEAMASGLPVLGTPIGGTKEILNRIDPGFLFQDLSADSIADLILEKFQIIKGAPEKWTAISKKCRQFVQKNYSWERHLDALENLLKTV